MKFPIAVIGTSPRCGSTAFVELLEQKLKVKVFPEPWCSRIYSSDKSYMKAYVEYLEYRKKSNRYIVKFWLNELDYRSPYHDEINNGYKILLMRRDIVAQLASWYIADRRDKFNTLISEQEENYTIEIKPKQISILISTLTRNLFDAKNLDIFDQRIYYEDIDFSELKSNYKKTQQPKNLEEIKKEIENQLKDTIPHHWIYFWKNTK
jgi:hypothetical protein